MTASSGLRTTFSEVMAGHCRVGETGRNQSCRMELDVDVGELLHPLADVVAGLRGRVVVGELADDAEATGTIHIAPLTRKRIRYQLDFTALDGRRLHLDGWKSVSYRRPVRSMTTLPATLTDESGQVVGQALVRFHIGRDLGSMLRSVRLRPGGSGDRGELGELAPKWDGTRGRLEVWYTTLTDPATGTGFWVHHELLAPSDGSTAHVYGWATVFPPGETPHCARFGPHDRRQPREHSYVDTPGATAEPYRLTGTAGDLEWSLTTGSQEPTLYTFPRWAWNTGLLPGAQVVPQPAARYQGTIRYGERTLSLEAAPGATAHIYGHGNAHRWAWLHADLGDGDVAEVVAAVSRRPLLRHLPPLPFVRLRIDGRDWPAGDTLLAALRLRADINLPTWRVWGRIGDYRVRIEVSQPATSTVAMDYTDPDTSPAVCRNSERADAHIVLEHQENGWWHRCREWNLSGSAHAEVGTRE